MKVTKNFIEDWQRAYERERDKTEKRNISRVRNFYRSEYNKGVDQFINNNNTVEVFALFKENDLRELYSQVYVDTGLHFANWYARNFDKFATKGINPSQYQNIWQEKFAAAAVGVANTNVRLIQGTARRTLLKLTTKILRDPDFQKLGPRQQARILRKQFDGYSKFQAERFIRTESTNISNIAVKESALTVYSEDQLLKRWSVTLDGRERDIHSAMAGTDAIPINEDFIVGGEPMDKPGDRSRASARNLVNCRCTAIYIPKEDATTEGFTDIGFNIGGQSLVQDATFQQIATAIATGIDEAPTSLNYSNFKARNRSEAIKIANKLGVKHADFDGLDVKVINEYLVGLVKLQEKFKGFKTSGYGTKAGLRNMLKNYIFNELLEKSKELRNLIKIRGESAIRKKIDKIILNGFKYRNANGRLVNTLTDRQGVYASRLGFKNFKINIGSKIYTVDVSQFTGIYHNGKNYKKFDMLDKSLKEMTDVRWSSNTNNPIQHLVMHEAGHQIDYTIDFVKSKEFETIFKKYNKGVDYVTENLSEYATKNRREFIAEAFSEYLTSNNPRPIAVEIGEAMARLWKPDIKNFIKPVDNDDNVFFFNLPQTEPKFYNKIKALLL